MIIKCKFCSGSGKEQADISITSLLGGSIKACPVCHGSGELVLPGAPENYIVCKVCRGAGGVSGGVDFFAHHVEVCSGCKGAGILQRPVLHPQGSQGIVADFGPAPRPTQFEFDIALSFAGEDRDEVEAYANALKNKGLKVFLDSDQQAELWGADLYVKLDQIYRTQAMFCVMFLSKHYAIKRWPNHERKSAQARAFKENKEYILPVRLDDTEIPGIGETIGYIDLRQTSMEDLVLLTFKKVKQEREKTQRPTTDSSGRGKRRR